MLDDALRVVLSGQPPRAVEDVTAWWRAEREAIARATTAGDDSPWDAAVRGGAAADRIGWAFAAGYQAALWSLLPDRDRTRAAALCATEAGGAHPRAIATELRDGALHGEKTFVTLGTEADELLVLARAGETPDGRVALVLASVAADAPGVSRTPLAPTPFVPEVPHAAVRFDGVRFDGVRFDGAAAEVLPGDGWTDYVRPFRTVEDVHVHAAFVAWLTASAKRWGWPAEDAERGVALLCAWRALSGADPASPITHVAVAGAIGQTRAWVDALEPRWASAPASDRTRWTRDRPLLEVASKARERRRERAWQRL